ncbi:MAG: outer membrane beta-barrel protein [Bacteroidales bacterium]|nr:outer membrane beta-barrel protein [Bacteroidales bacterium]
MKRHTMNKFLFCLSVWMLLSGGMLSARQPDPAAERDAADTTVYTPRKGWPKADKRFYFDLCGGYGFKMGSGYTGTLLFNEIGDHTDYKAIKQTLGAGWQGGLNFGYHFNRYMAIEVGIGYIKSGFSASQLLPCDTSGLLFLREVREIIWREPSEPCSVIAFSDDFSGHIGNLSVSLRVSPGFRRWDPYLKLGVNLMVDVISHKSNVELGHLYALQYNEYHNRVVVEDETWGGFGRSRSEKLVTASIGFTAAFGINCRFTPTVSMFAEWQFTLMSSESRRDHWMWDGNDYGNEAYRHVLDNAVGKSDVRSDFVLPFSNTGLNIGFKFAF